ncbi:sugar transferase [Oenococcus oeni]|uniref:sugar transferase n=4 Tax=Oenococcus oeni TaxID=1247 RepID=UPI00027777A0|nr:sugar transferase [Oenococcus oeni]EJN92345.1 lipopolysaccharide synthesis sugar transferase [Oenococcus oeni AWRIB304]EJO00812.1 lipopolysaccharide synthesis sugar transferase [Oenococcus oeni AWRIB318]EKP90953.1 lipopolysaccharide synthesis sugar transferase [Oenococcus oeni AWRIB202]KER91335.1 UDP-phosphate galactose phosphotransferase [Oenococcus oeni]KER97130.1 UDP-phosphate galactose phosphotransferase [Oenococcus oeni]
MDIFGGLFGLILSIIPIIFLAVRIKKDGGPVFYAQERIGKNGKSFTMYKLRSMVTNADDLKDTLLEKNELHGGLFKIKEDPRVTKIGRTIRHYSLDELPQFWNVVKGDMSLVGPRPCLKRELAQYSEHDKQRLLVKPGISGLWQTSGRSNLDFADMIKLDLQYIEKRSIKMDLKICFKTIGIVLFSEDPGAY